MTVMARAVLRGLARSASIIRRARTSSATLAARLSSTATSPAPRRRAERMRLAATRSPVASSRSSAKARNAADVFHRAASRAVRVATCGRIAVGAERRLAVMACSSPTPTASTPARFRVHSSKPSNRSMPALVPALPISRGNPRTATGTASASTASPVSNQPSSPAATANSSRSRPGTGPWRRPGSRVFARRAHSDGGRPFPGASGTARSPSTIKTSPPRRAATVMPAATGIMSAPSSSARRMRSATPSKFLRSGPASPGRSRPAPDQEGRTAGSEEPPARPPRA